LAKGYPIQRNKMDTTRNRNNAGANETEDIQTIVHALHTKTSAGLKLMTSFKEKFGLELLDARERAGNRGVHYDFQILVKTKVYNIREKAWHFQEVWKNVEHKGSQSTCPIPPEQTPWAAGVQFHNGGCDKYTIGRLYARCWYDTLISSGKLKSTWNLTSSIPTFEEWFHKDAKRQDDPSTEFGMELKKKVRESGQNLGDMRKEVHEVFKPTDADLALFKEEVLTILNKCLNEKEYWLTIHGNILTEFHCAWYPQFLLTELTSVTMRKEKDIWFDFVCPESKFSCILRWGKGAGFSNLRIDARDTP